MFRNGQKGAFSDFMRINAGFAIKIPDQIPLEKAGPLMCAGTTTFAPFRTHNIKPGESVGVLGIGGLGHMSIQFGRAFGCEVYALTRGLSKETEARNLGAKHVINTEDPKAMESIFGKLNYLMVTAGGPSTDVGLLMKTLATGGKMILMGFITHEVKVSIMELISYQKTVCGSAAGSTTLTKDMLEFCALHNILPLIETYRFDEINSVFDKVSAGHVRYRAVLLH